jgi:hypothetical protein
MYERTNPKNCLPRSSFGGRSSLLHRSLVKDLSSIFYRVDGERKLVSFSTVKAIAFSGLNQRRFFMAYTANETTKRALDIFQKFDTDTKLALLWFGYLDLKEQLNPAPPSAVETMGKAVFDQINVLSRDEQLQAQRDMINGTQSEVGKAYLACDSSARMDSWLLLARGMEDGTIVPMPDDYQLPEETNEFTDLIKQVNFEERVNFMRSAVMPSGS